MREIKKIPFFFILGRGRSGTTLLRTFFDAHPNINIPLESPLIYNLYLKYKNVKNWTKDTRLQFFTDVIQQWNFSSWKVNPDKLKFTILEYQYTPSFSNFIKIVYLNYISFYEKKEIKILGDKNPRYALHPVYFSKLIKIFPDAKFIHITRDYRDVFLSFKKVDFEAPIIWLNTFRWKYSFKSIFKFFQKYPENYIHIRYEDLITDTEKILKKLCAFLGIEFYSKMQNYHNKKHEFIQAYSKEYLEKYFHSLLYPVDSGHKYLWKEEMPEYEVKIADNIVGKYAEKAGYERKYKKRNLLLQILSLPWIFYARVYFWYLLLFEHLPYKIRNVILNKGPILSSIYHRIFRKV